MKRALIITTKAPLPRISKTRLYPFLTYEEAALLTDCFLKDLILRFSRITNLDIFISFYPEGGYNKLMPLIKPSHLILQKKATLCNKIFEIITHLRLKPYCCKIIIPSDSPDIPLKYLQYALRLLASKTKKVCIGPAIDQGFYLLGINFIPDKNIFDSLDWGGKANFLDVVRVCKNNNLRIKMLPIWHDIDDYRGLINLLKREAKRRKPLLPHTRRLILDKLYPRIF